METSMYKGHALLLPQQSMHAKNEVKPSSATVCLSVPGCWGESDLTSKAECIL